MGPGPVIIFWSHFILASLLRQKRSRFVFMESQQFLDYFPKKCIKSSMINYAWSHRFNRNIIVNDGANSVCGEIISSGDLCI